MTSAASVRIQLFVHRTDQAEYRCAKPFSFTHPHTNTPYSLFQDRIESR